jgi:hypothetical protein
MSEDQAYLAENDAERERLRALVARLSDAELQRPMPAGWTVAAVLAHAGFWDARALALMDKWAGGVAPAEADQEPEDIDWANDATKLLFLALPPREAANLALRLAEETDARVAALGDEVLAQNEAAGTPLNVSRAEHRREHLDEIERALGV